METAKNFLAGLRLSIGRKVSIEDFYISLPQIMVMFSLLLFAEILISYLVTPQPFYFNLYGINDLAALHFIVLIFIVVVAVVFRTDVKKLLLIDLSTTPIFIFINYSLYAWYTNSDEIAYFSAIFYYFMMAWQVFVVYRTLDLVIDISVARKVLLACMYPILLTVWASYVPQDEIWYSEYEESGNDTYKKFSELNIEDIYYSQPKMNESAVSSLLAQRDGVVDLYLLAMGGYGLEKVFLNEVEYVRDLFEANYDTKGQSIVLVNNIETVDKYPLANLHNMDYALANISRNMNIEEDVLFLFMTSHGSSEHKFSLKFGSLKMNDLTPEMVRQSLDISGIKWRVIIVSSCYSGGFIDNLKTPTSLIITASAKDKTSFGCGDKSEFTDFGTAYLKQGLQQNNNFIEAFSVARQWVEDKEKTEGRGASSPQIYIGEEIRNKIVELP